MRLSLICTLAALMVSSGAAAAPTGDPVHGQQLFARCAACHTVEAGGPNRLGPNLHGVVGRKAGGAAGFHYTDAMKAQTFIWDEGRLDRWLTDPRALVPGTAMILRTPSDADRRDLIAYLKAAR